MATGQKLDRYAIQLSDLAALSAWHPLRLLLFPVITEETANLGTKFDAVGLVVRHDDAERLSAILQIAASAPLPGAWYPLRMYHNNGKGWKRFTPQPAATE